MPILVAASTKGGASKSTQLMILVNWLLYNTDVQINVVDCDEKDDLSAWVNSLNDDEKLRINLNQARSPAKFLEVYKTLDPNDYTLIDLEGSANELTTMAIRLSHLIILPMTPSASDAKQAFKTLANIKMQEDKALNNNVEIKRHRVFTFSRTNHLTKTKAQQAIEAEIFAAGEKLLPVTIPDSTAFEAMGACGTTLQNLPTGGKLDPTEKQKEAAIKNADLFVTALIDVLNETRG